MVRPRVLFVTGRLAEPALRRVVAKLPEIEPEIAVLPISVAALLTTEWVGRHLTPNSSTDRVVLPGFCRGDLKKLGAAWHTSVERGPIDLRDLPRYFGAAAATPDLSRWDISILAEINHAPTLTRDALLAQADRMRRDGADVIDLGCDPGPPWAGVGDAVRALRDAGHRVSVDSFHPDEARAATRAGAELVLSVNSTNLEQSADWGVEVVAVPDDPDTLAGLDTTINWLTAHGVKHCVDPILEPIGCGFAASLGRYLEVRRRYPDAEMMMGVGNLTELSDVDSAGVNFLLVGFCQELGIRSVLTTQVINWARGSVRELDLARRIVAHAVREGMPPKRLSTDLVMLRDPRLSELGPEELAELATNVTDRNYRLFAEAGEIHVINAGQHLHGGDPFALFDQVCRSDAKMNSSHAFYLGYEMAKAVTALTLGKQYQQDRALNWGYLTRPEQSHHPEASGDGRE